MGTSNWFCRAAMAVALILCSSNSIFAQGNEANLKNLKNKREDILRQIKSCEAEIQRCKEDIRNNRGSGSGEEWIKNGGLELRNSERKLEHLEYELQDLKNNLNNINSQINSETVRINNTNRQQKQQPNNQHRNSKQNSRNDQIRRRNAKIRAENERIEEENERIRARNAEIERERREKKERERQERAAQQERERKEAYDRAYKSMEPAYSVKRERAAYMSSGDAINTASGILNSQKNTKSLDDVKGVNKEQVKESKGIDRLKKSLNAKDRSIEELVELVKSGKGNEMSDSEKKSMRDYIKQLKNKFSK